MCGVLLSVCASQTSLRVLDVPSQLSRTPLTPLECKSFRVTAPHALYLPPLCRVPAWFSGVLAAEDGEGQLQLCSPAGRSPGGKQIRWDHGWRALGEIQGTALFTELEDVRGAFSLLGACEMPHSLVVSPFSLEFSVLCRVNWLEMLGRGDSTFWEAAMTGINLPSTPVNKAIFNWPQIVDLRIINSAGHGHASIYTSFLRETQTLSCQPPPPLSFQRGGEGEQASQRLTGGSKP